MNRLEAAKERESKATPGPWEVFPYWFTVNGEPTHCDVRIEGTEGVPFVVENALRSDADFIAHSRTDFPEALAVVEAAMRLREARTEVSRAVPTDDTTWGNKMDKKVRAEEALFKALEPWLQEERT